MSESLREKSNKRILVLANNDVGLYRFRKDLLAALLGAGVNLEDYPYQSYPQEGAVRFLFVGRVMREKGVDELFAAAKRMKQEYGDGVEFHIVGSFEEGYKPLMDELEKAGVLKYHGYQSDMKRFYAMASWTATAGICALRRTRTRCMGLCSGS